ncbi:hypothetical protein LNKW23_18490 [Paralimibaculum aggregatum]|uniref:Uncharacterized protein n=1 Tax=Paralimibaculum aggregatum TaxID=3036245 RepID=A0ABQ6LH63_9RHOB|nr:hypothetical protein LNKW23_18490 [Limibaculum sp. NKW23]
MRIDARPVGTFAGGGAAAGVSRTGSGGSRFAVDYVPRRGRGLRAAVGFLHDPADLVEAEIGREAGCRLDWVPRVADRRWGCLRGAPGRAGGGATAVSRAPRRRGMASGPRPVTSMARRI